MLCVGFRDFRTKWEFPKIGGTTLRVPIMRTIIFWGLHWDPPIQGNYQIYVLFIDLAPGEHLLLVSRLDCIHHELGV